MVAIIVVGVGLSIPLGACTGPAAPRPNLVLISLDTLRRDHLGIYGYERDTSPNLDRLAERGVVFDDAYSHGPNTSTTHHSILTSLYPSVHGVFRHGELLDPNVPTLPELLEEAGYATAGFVQLPGPNYSRGFDVYTGLTHYASMRRAERFDASLASIGEWISGLEEGTPFFLFVHSYAVHLPYTPPDEYIERFDPDYEGPVSDRVNRDEIDAINRGEIPVDEEDLAHVVALYDAEIAALDADLGRLFGAFESMGLMEDTVFVILADHGEEFGDHGRYGLHSHTLYQELIRIPLIVIGPDVPRGRRVEGPVRQVDVAPTLLEFAGVDPPEHFLGASVAPLWSGTEDNERIVLAERPSGRVFIAGGLKYFTDGRLYDLTRDPGELNDIARERPDDLFRMQQLAEAWEEEMARYRELVARPGGVVLTDEERRRLRALGYLR